MPRLRLTDIAVRALKTERTQESFFDTTTPGFGVRCTKSGTKTYVVMHGKERKLTTLGRVGTLALKDARQKARDILSTHEETTITVKQAVEAFIELHVKVNNRPSTAKETSSVEPVP